MSNISVSLDKNLYGKLAELAAQSGRSVEDCLELAVTEYIENYEDACRTDLNAVDRLERSFFFAAAE